MTAPEVAAGYFLRAFFLGCGLGVLYGFLRPLRPKWTALADGLFLLGAFWAWLTLSFGICGGDIRLVYTLGLGLGCLVFDRALGRLLKPVFGGFWNLTARILAFLLYPAKIISKFAKIMFASLKKWVTIVWCNRPHSRKKLGGRPYGKNHGKTETDQAAPAPQSPRITSRAISSTVFFFFAAMISLTRL